MFISVCTCLFLSHEASELSRKPSSRSCLHRSALWREELGGGWCVTEQLLKPKLTLSVHLVGASVHLTQSGKA